ncbi:hypothetical protein OG244_28640 [Streptomyces brevispora]|uniref:DUF6221 family protein n=1 Tax=Streptomyces brevispora TaxID=887462 RepID=UPI002E33CDC3|nr:DUF6221 family protein [Streptomyces brevispora]
MARRARGPKELVTVAEYDVTPGLHEWIEGEIQRREQTSRDHQQACGAWEYDDCVREVRDRLNSGTVATVYRKGAGDFMALNDPDDALRRCAADRKILAAHPYSTVAGGRAGFGCDTCHQSEYGGTEDDGNCATILALAEAYGLEPADEDDVEVIRD